MLYCVLKEYILRRRGKVFWLSSNISWQNFYSSRQLQGVRKSFKNVLSLKHLVARHWAESQFTKSTHDTSNFAFFKQKSKGLSRCATVYAARESVEFGRVSKAFDTWVAFSQISPGGPWVTAGGCVFEERAQPLPRAVTAASPAAACAALGPSRRRRSGYDISGVFMFSSARLDLWFAILKTFRVQTRRGVWFQRSFCQPTCHIVPQHKTH